MDFLEEIMFKKAVVTFTGSSLCTFALVYTLIYAQMIPGLTPDLEIKGASVNYLPELELLILRARSRGCSR